MVIVQGLFAAAEQVSLVVAKQVSPVAAELVSLAEAKQVSLTLIPPYSR